MRPFLALLALLGGIPAHALSPLRPSDFSLRPAPRAGSAEEQRDFREMRRLELARTARQCELGNRYNHGHGVFTVLNLFGDLLSPVELRQAGPFLSDALYAANSLANAFKRVYARPYPFEHAGITSCAGDGKGDGSYPSGHATVGIAVACLAAELFPRKAEQLLERGRFHGDIRVPIGRHFPSDVEEGQRLGLHVCHSIQSDPEFLDLRKALR